MAQGRESDKEPGAVKGGLDPLQLIIWGILLLVYGNYSIYQLFVNPPQSDFTFFVLPYVVIVVFGGMITVKGYVMEMEDRKQKASVKKGEASTPIGR